MIPEPLARLSRARRVLLLGSAWGLLLGRTPRAGGQTAAPATVKVDAAAEVTAALAAAAITLAATARSADREIQSQRQQVLAVQAEVRAGRAEASALQAAQQALLDRLAAKDREFALDMLVFRQTLERIVATPEGAQALRRFNGGEQREALDALDQLAASRRAARQPARDQEDAADVQADPQLAKELKERRQKRRDTEDALDLRDNARLALEAQGRQRVPLAEVIQRFEQVTGLDPRVSLDKVTLSRLYRQADRLESMKRVAQEALQTALQDRERALALSEAGSAERLAGRLDTARRLFEDALKLRLEAVRNEPRAQDLRRYLSVAHERLGELALDEGAFVDAIEQFKRNVDLRRDLQNETAPALSAPRDLAVALGQLARALLERGEVGRARAALAEALTLNTRLLEADRVSAELQRDQAVLLARAGDLDSVSGAPVEAQRHYEKSLEIRRRLSEQDKSSVRLARDLVAAEVKRTDLELQRGGDAAWAKQQYDNAARRLTELRGAPDEASGLQRDLNVVIAKVAAAKALAGDHRAALSDYTRVLDSLRKLEQDVPGQYVVQRDWALVLTRMGDSLLAGGDARAARDRFDDSLRLRQKMLERDRDARTTRALIVQSQSKLGLAYERLKDKGREKIAYDRANEELTRLLKEGQNKLDGVPESPELILSVALLAEAMNDTSYAERVRPVVEDMKTKKLFSPRDAATLEDLKRRGRL